MNKKKNEKNIMNILSEEVSIATASHKKAPQIAKSFEIHLASYRSSILGLFRIQLRLGAKILEGESRQQMQVGWCKIWTKHYFCLMIFFPLN